MEVKQQLVALGIALGVLIIGFFLDKVKLVFGGSASFHFPILAMAVGCVVFIGSVQLIAYATDYVTTQKGMILGAIAVITLFSIMAHLKEGKTPGIYVFILILDLALIGYVRNDLYINKKVINIKLPEEVAAVELGPVWYQRENIKAKSDNDLKTRESIWHRTGPGEYKAAWKDGGETIMKVSQKGAKIEIQRLDFTQILYDGTLDSDGKRVWGNILSSTYTGTWEAKILDSEYTATPTPTKTPLPTLTPRPTQTPTIPPTKVPAPYTYQSSQSGNSPPAKIQKKGYQGENGRITGRVWNADDKAILYVNGAEAISAAYKKDPAMVDITRYFYEGDNEVRLYVWNEAICCGTSGSFEVKIGNKIEIKENFSKQDSSSGVKFDRTYSMNLKSQEELRAISGNKNYDRGEEACRVILMH